MGDDSSIFGQLVFWKLERKIHRTHVVVWFKN